MAIIVKKTLYSLNQLLKYTAAIMGLNWLIDCFKSTLQCVVYVKYVYRRKHSVMQMIFEIMPDYQNTKIYTFTISTVIVRKWRFTDFQNIIWNTCIWSWCCRIKKVGFKNKYIFDTWSTVFIHCCYHPVWWKKT